MPASFTKRTGTSDDGRDFEDLLTALLAFKLATDDQVKNFELSSNDSRYEGFDDIVVDISYKDNTTKCYAIQLKHHEKKKNITKDMLGAETGNFSIQKYLKNYNIIANSVKNNVECIIYTCATYNVPTGDSFQLKGEKNCIITVTKQEEIDLLKSSQNNKVYKFEITNGDHTTKNLYKDFLSHFSLYPNQKNSDETEIFARQSFQNFYSCDERSFNDYVTYIKKWSNLRGTKLCLNKEVIQKKIAKILLAPYLKTSSSPKLKLFKEAYTQYDVTIVDTNKKDLLKMFNQEPVKKKEDEVFIVKVERGQEGKIFKTVQWCLQNGAGIRFVLLGESIDRTKFRSAKIFQNLHDLTSNTFKKMVKNKVSIQGRKSVALQYIIDEEVKKKITTSELIQSMNNKLQVGEDKEQLPEPYIEQFLFRTDMNLDALLQVHTSSSLLVFSCNNNLEYIPKLNEVSNSIVKIYKEECTQENFQIICQENPSKICHHFSVCSDGKLKWNASKRNDFSFSDYIIAESEMVNMETKINIICGQSGMGKSVMLKYLKNNFSSDYWVIDINLTDKIFNDKLDQSLCDILQHILDYQSQKRNYSPLDENIRKAFLKRNKMILLWNGVNKLSSNKIEVVLKAIRDMLDRDFITWVTAKNCMETKLRDIFDVFPLKIRHLDSDQREKYINDKLFTKFNQDQTQTIKETFTSLFQSWQCIELLKIPLQLKILTKLFQDHPKKYHDLNNKCLLIAIIQYVVEQTFDFYRQGKTEERQIPEHTLTEQIWVEHKDSTFGYYQTFALKCLLSKEHFNELCLSNTNIRITDKFGVIEVMENNSYTFSSNIFGKYFAAFWFSKNSNYQYLLENECYRNIKNLFNMMPPSYGNGELFF